MAIAQNFNVNNIAKVTLFTFVGEKEVAPIDAMYNIARQYKDMADDIWLCISDALLEMSEIEDPGYENIYVDIADNKKLARVLSAEKSLGHIAKIIMESNCPVDKIKFDYDSEVMRYTLCDMFEALKGSDDDRTPHAQECIKAMTELTNAACANEVDKCSALHYFMYYVPSLKTLVELTEGLPGKYYMPPKGPGLIFETPVCLSDFLECYHPVSLNNPLLGCKRIDI